MPKFAYFNVSEADQYSFFRVPKALFTDNSFQKLSCESKVLYGLMLDRISLSIKNNWIDEEGHAYIIFQSEEISELMGCGKQKAYKLLAELDTDGGIGLIERCRRGQGRVNIIYVKNFNRKEEDSSDRSIQKKETDDFLDGVKERRGTNREIHSEEVAKTGEQGKGESEDFQKYENHTSRSMKTETSGESYFKEYENHTSRSMNIILQEVPKSYSNKTNINNINRNDTDLIISHPSINPDDDGRLTGERLQDRRGDDARRWSAVRESVKEQVGYSALAPEYGQEQVDEIIEIITDIIASNAKSIIIGGNRFPGEVVRGRFRKLNYFHIQYVFQCLSDLSTRIHNVRKYMIATLYNAPTTMETYYDNRVKVDMEKLYMQEYGHITDEI